MNAGTTITAIGMMSGTSMDGVDAALVRSDGHEVEAFGPAVERAYGPDERALIREAIAAAAKLQQADAWPADDRDFRVDAGVGDDDVCDRRFEPADQPQEQGGESDHE